jgi:4-hydroxybenzoate polyprenyltransferase
VLEALYCKLMTVTWWRTLASGLVKSAGPNAEVFVVRPEPSPGLLLLLLAWLMSWEIGGQNIPADWNDIEEDRRIGARTIPLLFGTRVASALVVATLASTVLLSLWLPLMSPLALGWPFRLACLAVGGVLLLWPALRLYRSRDGRDAARLFDRASLYPLAQLAVVLVFVLVP